MRHSSGMAILGASTALLAGCGAAASTTSASSKRAPSPAAAGATPLADNPAAAPLPGASTPAPATCTRAADRELVAVAERIYAQAASGRNETASVNRIGRSRRLSAAVAASDPVAAQAALRPLIKHQITAITVKDASGKVLAHYGTAATYAPTTGRVLEAGRAVGSFTLSVSDDKAFASLLYGLTGVTATFAPARLAGADHALPATGFPDTPEQISLAMPRLPGDVCGRTPADTRLKTIGYVGHNLAVDEERGPGAVRTIRHAERNPAFRKAVIARDPHALWNAIVGFFRDSRYHVVRVRAWNGSQLIGDVGGPYVLDPAIGEIEDGGRPAGRFMLAIQDDTGFIKLMHRFTGARVVLHMAGKTVPGSTLFPGPSYAPGLTRTAYHGVAYRSYGLLATAFPASALQVSLLVR